MAFDRNPANPILTRVSIPESRPALHDVSSVFNPAAVLFESHVHLLLRVQTRGRETFLMHAVSADGIDFEVDPKPIGFIGLDAIAEAVCHIYDPRLTCLDGRFYIVVAMDLATGCRLGLAVTEDFRHYEFRGLISHDDTRNGVLFPEPVGGRYLLLDRPNRPRTAGRAPSGDEIRLMTSPDLQEWTPQGTVLQGNWRYWDERIGAGPPPVKTREGWLLVYHGVATHFASAHVYQVGAALLDADDPSRVLARTRRNILEPREMYEQVGQVPNVVFPGGMVVWDTDADGYALSESRVSLYYGAADTVVGLAETTIARLLDACHND